MLAFQIYSYLLPIHITAGFIALATSFAALISAKGKKLHRIFGQLYFASMVVIFCTALPMALIKSNFFLFLIAIFSFYFAFQGLAFAKNRTGKARRIDWIGTIIMALLGLSMWALAAYDIFIGNTQAITLILFGIIAITLGGGDFYAYKHNVAVGKKRIARHLTNMMAGTIAVITAVLVVNVDIEPQWIWWILPTIIITPLIIWQNIKTLR